MQELNLFQKKKEDIKNIFMDIDATNDKERKYDLYKKILKIDNTDRDIVLQYLLLVKQIRKPTDKNPNPVVEIMTYIHHFPLEQFNKIFVGFAEKKISSMGKLLLFLKKILNKDWTLSTFEERKAFINFFFLTKEEDKLEIKNTSPFTWENDELYIFFLYKEFLSRIEKKIEHYISDLNDIEIKSVKIIECDKYIQDMKDELKKPNRSESFILKTLQLIEKAEKNRKIYALIEGNFFKKYLKKFNSFLCGIQDTYLKELSATKFKKKEEKNMFEYFMFFISNYNFEGITSVIRDIWKYSFIDEENDKINKLIEQYKQEDPSIQFKFEKNNKLIIKSKNIEEILINNFNDYLLEYLLSDIYKYEKFIESKAIEYLKIPKIKDHLYINKIFENWLVFIIIIFNSETVKSLFQTMFETQNIFLLDPDELSIVLNNITFYTFDTDFPGLTLRGSMKIYIYANYENLIDLNDQDSPNEDVLKVIFLAFNLIINYHEILVHFNIGYQRYSSGEDKKDIYNSPKISKDLSSDYAKSREGKESGEDIEIKLFGRVISDLTLKEALFILNPTNYLQNDYQSFKNKFMKCNEEKLYIDEVFWDYLVNSFQINPKKILGAENKRYSLNDLIKKSTNKKERFVMKRKHPLGYNIDGLQEKDYVFINGLLESLNKLDEAKW